MKAVTIACVSRAAARKGLADLLEPFDQRFGTTRYASRMLGKHLLKVLALTPARHDPGQGRKRRLT
jgi:hypothetical protein